MPRSLLLCGVTTVLLALMVAAAADAQGIPRRRGPRDKSPVVYKFEPLGAQRGSTFRLTVEGERLGSMEEVLAYRRGIVAQRVVRAEKKKVTFDITLANDAPLGELPFRLRTRHGVTGLRTLQVGAYPTKAEQEPNNKPLAAQAVQTGTTIRGILTKADIDCFAVDLQKGQRISAEVEGMRLGVSLVDPHLSLLDDKGRVWMAVDDTSLLRQDPNLTFVAPRAGRYVIKLREAAYGGGKDFTYRLHIGGFARPAVVFPLGGPVDATLPMQLIEKSGRTHKSSVELPDRVGVTTFYPGKDTPSAHKLRVVPFGNAFEAENNDSRQKLSAEPSMVPVALNGVLQTPGDVDYFAIQAKQDGVLDVCVWAAQLGSPVDSLLIAMDAEGGELARNDDSAIHDSRVRFWAVAGQTYYLSIRDQRKRGGPDFVYRMEATASTAELRLSQAQVGKIPSRGRSRRFFRSTVVHEHRPVVVPRGARSAVLIASKRDGFAGPVRLAVENLPAGVRMLTRPTPADGHLSPLVLQAEAGAPLGAKLLKVFGEAEDAAGKKIRGGLHKRVALLRGPPTQEVYYSVATDAIAAVVVEEAPFQLRVDVPRAPIVRSGRLGLRVSVRRKPGYDEPIHLSLLHAPPAFVEPKNCAIEANEDSTIFWLRTDKTVELRSWDLVVVASANTKQGTLHLASKFVPVTVAKPFVDLTLVPTSGEQGKPVSIQAKLKRFRDVQGTMQLKLMGVPKRARVATVSMDAQANDAAFTLKLAKNSPIGSYTSLFCELTLKHNGEDVVHYLAYGSAVDVYRPGEMRDEKGTILDRLRQRAGGATGGSKEE